jgi:predicted nucleotidyltransferase
VRARALAPSELALLKTVLRRHPEITSVRLFVSRAKKGTDTFRSDIDLALWDDIGMLKAQAIAADLDELPLPYRFDVQPFDSIKARPFREHIERAGIVLYTKDTSPDARPAGMSADEIEASIRELRDVEAYAGTHGWSRATSHIGILRPWWRWPFGKRKDRTGKPRSSFVSVIATTLA